MKALRLLASFLLLTSVNNIYACSCIGQESVEQSVKNADAVFTGTVIDIQEVTDTIEDWGFVHKEFIYTFQIEKTYKKSQRIKTYVKVKSGYGGGDCGFRFSLGGKYIVYSYKTKEKKVFTTNICTRTQQHNAKEIEELEKLTN